MEIAAYLLSGSIGFMHADLLEINEGNQKIFHSNTLRPWCHIWN